MLLMVVIFITANISWTEKDGEQINNIIIHLTGKMRAIKVPITNYNSYISSV